MRKQYKFFIIINFLLIIQSCKPSQQLVITPEVLKAEALTFSLEMVETYFTLDCEKYYEQVSDTIYIMDGDGVVSKVGKKTRICKTLNRAIPDKSKSMKDYLETYQAKILTVTELEQSFEQWKKPTYYNPLPNDYFFIGFEVKASKQHIPNFLWDDMFVFMVRKVNEKWVLKGVSG